jgi:hypothetical protein
MSQEYMIRGHCERPKGARQSAVASAAWQSQPFSMRLLRHFVPRNDNGERKNIKMGTGYFFGKKENCLYSWTIHTEKVACPLKKVKK